MNKTPISARMRADGHVVEVLQDGSERPFAASTSAWTPGPDSVPDPDCPSLAESPEFYHPVPRTRTLRRALGLTLEQFAARYAIPAETLRAWESGGTEPDAAARAYLRAIAGNPSAVSEALQRPAPHA